MATTTPSGVAALTSIDLAGAPFTANHSLKAAPPLRAVPAVAKPALVLRWAAARVVTETEWLPVAALAPATTESAAGWLLPGVMLLKLLSFLRAVKAALRLLATNLMAA